MGIKNCLHQRNLEIEQDLSTKKDNNKYKIGFNFHHEFKLDLADHSK